MPSLIAIHINDWYTMSKLAGSDSNVEKKMQ